MEAKEIKNIHMLRADFKKTEISLQLNVSRMTVHQVEQRFKASEPLKDRPRLERPQVISQEAIKKAFENDPCQKMTRLTQKKNISVVSTVSIIGKKWKEKSETLQDTPVECSNSSKGSGEQLPLYGMKNYENRICIFSIAYSHPEPWRLGRCIERKEDASGLVSTGLPFTKKS